MTLAEEIELLQTKLENTADVRAQGKILLEILNKYTSTKSTDSQKYIDRLLQSAEKLNEPHYKAWGFYHLAVLRRNSGEDDMSLTLSQSALTLFEGIKEMEGMASVYNNMGHVYKEQGNYPDALKNHFAALRIRTEAGQQDGQIEDKSGISNSYHNIGNIYRHSGDYPESLKSHFAALKLREEIADKSGIANSYTSIGNVYHVQGDYLNALNTWLSSLKLYVEIGNKPGIAKAYNNISGVYYKQGNYQEAIKSQLASLKIKEEIGDKSGMAASYSNLGNVYADQGNYQEALKNHFAALKTREEIGGKRGIVHSYGNIGIVYYHQGNYKEALKTQSAALHIAEDIGLREGIQESSLALADIYKALGDFENALKYYEKYHKIESEILGENTQKQLTNLSFQHNVEQTKKQIEIDQLKIVELQNEIGDIEMKALRAQMNPHFIFNSLNSINRFIQLNNTDDASEYLIKFSKLMRLILDNSRHKEVLIQKDLEALRLYMELESARMDHKFAFEIKIGEGVDPETMMIPPLILQPFVENAIWHGMSKKEGLGKIAIGITRENDMISCVVEDNGIGREKAMALKSSRPEKKHESLGMKLTHDRISILNRMKKTDASIAVTDLYDERKNASGTRVEVKLPLELCF